MAQLPSAGGGSGLTEAEVKALIAALAQPLDGDLTALAALATQEFGRELLVKATAAAVRTQLGLGTASTQASGAFDTAGAAASAQAASAAAIHAANHLIGGSDPLALPQYDLFDLLPYTVPMEMYPGTTQAPVAARAYFVRFTVSRKRVFKFIRWGLSNVGTNEAEKTDAGIYVVGGGGTKLERLGSSGAKAQSMLAIGPKFNEMTGNVTCEPGIVYFVASGWETVTGTPQLLALLNNNGSVGDMVGSGTLSNRLMLIKNASFPLPSEVTTFTSSSPCPYMLPSEV